MMMCTCVAEDIVNIGDSVSIPVLFLRRIKPIWLSMSMSGVHKVADEMGIQVRLFASQAISLALHQLEIHHIFGTLGGWCHFPTLDIDASSSGTQISNLSLTHTHTLTCELAPPHFQRMALQALTMIDNVHKEPDEATAQLLRSSFQAFASEFMHQARFVHTWDLVDATHRMSTRCH